MNLTVEPSGKTCGAYVTGLDLSQPPTDRVTAEIRSLWLEHKVLAFPDQSMSDDALEAFTLAMGGFGEDPFFAPIEGREHIAAILRIIVLQKFSGICLWNPSRIVQPKYSKIFVQKIKEEYQKVVNLFFVHDA